MTQTVHLGFEVGSGKAIEIPLKHMVVTGQTQEAGKTTALEALIVRSGLRAVTFVTKRGEGSFKDGRRLQPFFRERADWVFVSSLIDATLGEKNKLLRAWLMKVCRGTKTLAEVQHNVTAAKATARGFSESIYTEIEGYLELVVPQLAQLPPARKVEIGPGLNVMDLARYSTELQALVIRSVLEHVYEHEEGVVTVIPEAWEFLPEGRGSPVKREAEALIRKGAGLKNYVWLDSQDLAGVWKTAVRAAPVVLIGVQREANEIKRTLANIPAGIAKPTSSAVARLQLGEFFACWGQHTIKVYVQPAWATKDQAYGRALGEDLPARLLQEDDVNEDELRAKNTALIEENEDLRRRIAALEQQLQSKTSRLYPPMEEIARDDAAGRTVGKQGAKKAEDQPGGRGVDTPPSPSPARSDLYVSLDGKSAPHAVDDLYDEIKRRLQTEAPALLKVLVTKPELEVAVKRETVSTDGSGWLGRTALLLKEGYFKTARKVGEAHRENLRRGANGIPARTSEAMKSLLEKGFLTLEEEGYVEVAGMKVRIVEAA